MIINNHNLIYSFANSHHLDIDEYYDVLAIALIKAVDKYDSSLGFKFSTFAYKTMLGAVLNNIRDSKKDSLAHSISLDGNAEEENNLIDLCFVEEENRVVFHPTNLTDREKKVLHLYLKGYTQRSIAREVGTTQEKIANTMKIIIMKYKIANGENHEEFIE